MTDFSVNCVLEIFTVHRLCFMMKVYVIAKIVSLVLMTNFIIFYNFLDPRLHTHDPLIGTHEPRCLGT